MEKKKMKFQIQFNHGRIKKMKTQGSVSPAAARWIATLRICGILAGITANAHPIVEGWQNGGDAGPGFTFGPLVTLFDTSRNFGSNAQSSPLANNTNDQRYYIDLDLSYRFSDELVLFGRASGLYTRITGAGFTDQSALGLSDQMVGGSYLLLQTRSGFSWNLQGEAVLPAYSNNSSKTNGNPFMGDGSFDFTIGSFSEIPLFEIAHRSLHFIAGAGYTWRSYGFSSAVPWNLILSYGKASGEGLTSALGIRGNISLDTDVSSPSVAISDSNTGAGGSFLINALNPSWTLAQASIGYQSNDHIQYYLGGAIPLMGTNAPNGIEVSLGVVLNCFGNNKSEVQKNNQDQPKHDSIKNYDLEAKVASTNDQLYLIKIDKGSSSGIKKGQIFDIFQDHQPMASAQVVNVNSEESALRVLEYFQEQSIEVGAVVKRLH